MDELITQEKKVINKFMTGAQIAQARTYLSQMKKFTTMGFEVFGELDRKINEMDFKLEAIQDQCATLEDYRYCVDHDQELKLSSDGRFYCESCKLLKETGYPFECDQHGFFETSCHGCSQDDRKMGGE